MHYFGFPSHTRSMIQDRILTESVSGNSSEKLHCGNNVYMPYRKKQRFSLTFVFPVVVVVVLGLLLAVQ